MAKKQTLENEHEVSILLMHDAVYTPPENHFTLFSCQDDVEARGIDCPGTSVSYQDIVNLLLENDSIVSWPSL
jgi:sulfur transfer complex TusBCD TusB component (DsrH family)